MELPKELNDDIISYCRLNNINDVNEYISKVIKTGHMYEKYGASPFEKEKIVEKIIEKPIEKIVEKEVYITNDTQILTLTNKIDELNETIRLKDNDIEQLKKELEELKNDKDKLIEDLKNKKDIYGEN